jgi:hypothetical protein
MAAGATGDSMSAFDHLRQAAKLNPKMTKAYLLLDQSPTFGAASTTVIRRV